MDNNSIKKNIRHIRKSRKITQEEMAHKLGISLTAYRDLEKGNTAVMNGNVMKMADLLETSTEELILGYMPSQSEGFALEDIRQEYGVRITSLEKRIMDLEKLLSSQEENIRSKNEIISMLKKRLGEDN
jgi:transcriptional regulator with XRE-family HTH domain